MGRSQPTFAHPECDIYDYVENDDGTLTVGGVREFPEGLIYEPANETNIKRHLASSKRVNQECWRCSDCGFQLGEFHFLDYSGTRHLAEDMYRMRVILNAPSLHLLGVSYGTTVMSTYATLFPESTGLLVLDASVTPVPDMYHWASTDARTVNQRINYVIFSCEERDFADPGSCPVDNIRECIGDIASSYNDVGVSPGSSLRFRLNLLVRGMFEGLATEVCEAAAAGDIGTLEEIFATIRGVTNDIKESRPDFNATLAKSKPTSDDFVVGNPNYATITVGSPILPWLVNAQDRAGSIYDEDEFVAETQEFNARFTGAGTGRPGLTFMSQYRYVYYWPEAVPVPPAGHPSLTGKYGATIVL